jgi:hypothetical protein
MLPRVVLDDPTNVTDTTLNLHWSLNEDTDFSKYEFWENSASTVHADGELPPRRAGVSLSGAVPLVPSG